MLVKCRFRINQRLARFSTFHHVFIIELINFALHVTCRYLNLLELVHCVLRLVLLGVLLLLGGCLLSVVLLRLVLHLRLLVRLLRVLLRLLLGMCVGWVRTAHDWRVVHYYWQQGVRHVR